MVEIKRNGGRLGSNMLIFLVTYALCTFVCASVCVYLSLKFKGFP